MEREASKIYAKSLKYSNGKEVLLSEHTNDLLNSLESLKASITEKLYQLIKVGIYLHDLGKVLPYYQHSTAKNKEYFPFDLINIPHSFFSLLWIDKEKLKEHLRQIEGIEQKDIEDYKNFILSAVAYHHWRENFNDLIHFSNRDFERLSEKLNGNKGLLKSLTSNLLKDIDNINGFDKSLVGFDSEMLAGLTRGAPFSEYSIPPYQLYWLPKRVDLNDEKSIDWIKIAGFLIRCDHFASYCEDSGVDDKIEIEGNEFSAIKDKVKNRIKLVLEKSDKKYKEEEIWQFKNIEEYYDDNCILTAPTGYGKTEFSFLWSKGEKFFYTLPLRSAVNQIYDRAKEIFGAGDEDNEEENKKIGLLHSDADVHLIGDGAEKDNLKVYDLSRQLSYPVIVSTGDQFFPYALRPPSYEKIFATFSHSRLVIDEVQAYDPQAAAIIVKFIQDVVRMGGKFLLMTATLPDFIRDAIDDVLKKFIEKNQQTKPKEIDLYKGNEEMLNKTIKHKICTVFIDNTEKDFKIGLENLTPIIDTAKKNKRVLVILNTVKQAQDVYENLKKQLKLKGSEFENRIWLLHSRFTYSDRRKLEKETIEQEFNNPKTDENEKGKILVATQVIEASLDIDADVLFTEIAPLDALVQRMGRVLRRYRDNWKYEKEEPNVFVWIFNNGFESGYNRVYDKDLLGITKRILLLSEEDLNLADNKTIVDKIKPEDEQSNPAKKESKKKTKSKKQKISEETTTKMAPKNNCIDLSEYQKYKLVKALYNDSVLERDSNYKKRFFETLDLLEAGYMSDRKTDAEKMFREMNTVSIITGKKENSFFINNQLETDVNNFMNNHKVDEKRLYTFFKRDVLNKHQLNIPLNSKTIKIDHYNSLEYWIETKSFYTDWERKLKNWCRGIYFVEFGYDERTGINIIYDKQKDDTAFI